MTAKPHPVPAHLASDSVPNAYWRRATMLALAALACALLLGGLSAWFLGSVALAGLTATAFTFNFHTPGALVRLFAVGRTVAKYGERLMGHKAALTDQVRRRSDLFGAMAAAPAVRQRGWQLGDEARLADWLDDVEDLDYARLRVDMPAFSAGAGIVALLLATTWIAPLALVPIGFLFLAMLLLGGWLARTGAIAWEQRRSLQRDGAQGLGMAMASSVPLRAEGVWGSVSGGSLELLSQAEITTLATTRRQAAVDALGGAIGSTGLLCVIGAAWWSGLRGNELLVPTFVGFAWLALGETLNGLSRIVVARFRRDAARKEIAGWTALPSPSIAADALNDLRRMSFRDIVRIAPDGRPIGAPLTIDLVEGRPLVLTGPSGCGKTSLLKQFAGWIGEDIAFVEATPLQASTRRANAFFCPHDAAILDDTIRANLFAPAAGDEAIWMAIEAVELETRIRQAGGLDAWITQDQLSLGEAQRLNLARAFLSDRPIILLDEPTEHLDHEQAGRILDRLLRNLSDRLVAISSHREVVAEGVEIVSLKQSR